MDPFGRFTENSVARSGEETLPSRWADGTIGPHRGFDHLEFATHGAVGMLHYAQWLMTNHPEAIGMYYSAIDASFNVNAARRRRHRRPAGEGQPDPARLVPHRLGRRSHDRMARLGSTPTTTGSAG